MNDDLVKWIRYLHAAAAVPKDDPDYEEAQAAVAHAQRKIAFLNRQANRADVETPDAVETARMSGLANTAGALATAPLSMLDLGPGASAMTGPLSDFISRIAGKSALDVVGLDTDAYERGMEAHPTATAVGEMVPPVLMALAGRLGTKPAARFVSERLSAPVPEVPSAPAGFMTNVPSVSRAAQISRSDPISRLMALLRRR